MSASWAIEVTPEQAATAARNWIRKSSARMTAKFATSDAEGVQTSWNENDRALYHVVNLSGGGYVVAAGDTELPPVIAFSEGGRLDVGDARNPLLALLERDMRHRTGLVDAPAAARQKVAVQGAASSSFEAEWEELLDNSGNEDRGKQSVAKASLSSLSDVRVAPLVQSKWDQEDWNGYSTFNYYTPNGDPCGCVATAFSQIMRYWQMPTASVTARSTYCKVDEVSRVMTMKGGTYSWSSMPLTSASCSSLSQRQAIGKLTYDVGVASQMSYTSSESGTMGFAGSKALKNVFGYASSQSYFDVTGWGLDKALDRQTDFRDAILASLDAGMPCAVGVGGDNGGHEMVLDGYGFSGSVIYSHINCGWSGSQDAWYNFFGEYVTSHAFAYMDELGYNIHPTTTGDVLSGRVLNSSGSPVSGATVRLSFGSTSKTTTTNSKGIYAFRIASAGSYTVTASYGTQSGTATATVASMSVSTSAALDSSCTYDRSAGNGVLGNKWGVDVRLATSVSRPANDNFANATRISGASGRTSGTTIDATSQSGEPLVRFKAAATNTIWWVWTAPSSSTFTFCTTNTTFDTVMGIYSGSSLSGLATVVQNDDGGPHLTSICTFDAVAGATYYIAVSGYGSNQGTVVLNWMEALPDLAPYKPSGWGSSLVVASSRGETSSMRVNFGTADTLYVSWAVNCQNASVSETFYSALYVDGVFVSDWYTDGLDNGSYCWVSDYSIGSLPVGEHIIRITADSRGSVSESDEGNNVATMYIIVYDSVTVTLNKMGGIGGTASVMATYGNAMPRITPPTRPGYAFDGYFSGKRGSGTRYYNADGTGARVWGRKISVTLYANWIKCPANDSMNSPKKISGKYGECSGSNVAATRETYDPFVDFSYAPSASNSVWWAWKAPASGNFRFSTEGSSFDTVLGVFKGKKGSKPGNFIVYPAVVVNDDYTGDTRIRTSACDFKAKKGFWYYICVAGYRCTSGKIVLSWRPMPTVVVKFNANGGKLTGKTWKPVKKGKAVGALPTPKKAGCSFKGWYTKRNGGKKVTKNTKVKKAVTYYAHWSQRVWKDSALKGSPASAKAVSGKGSTTAASLLPDWAVGTFYGRDSEWLATITVSRAGKVSGKVLFADERWTIVGNASGQRIAAVVTDAGGNSAEVVLAIVKTPDGRCRIESEDGSIWAE